MRSTKSSTSSLVKQEHSIRLPTEVQSCINSCMINSTTVPVGQITTAQLLTIDFSTLKEDFI